MTPFRSILFALSASVGLSLAGAGHAQDQSANATVVLRSEPVDLDPCNVGEPAAAGFVVGQNIVETLTVLNPLDGSVQPKLATSWDDLGNGKMRLHLREGVKFHDGSDFNAAAVADSLKRVGSPDIQCEGTLLKLPKPKFTSEVIDDHTLDVSMEPIGLGIPTVIAFVGMSVPGVDPKTLISEPVGTGPYALVSFERGKSVVVKRFDQYWGAKPDLDEVTFVWRDDATLRATMVEVGEADLALIIPPQAATNPETDFSYPSGDAIRIRFVMQPPLDDIRVRKALNLAFDRNALIGTVLSKDVIPSTQQIGPSVLGYAPDLKVWPYDPEEAKRLLAEAKADGVPVDKEMKLYGRIGWFANVDEVAQVAGQMLNAVGFNIKTEMLERGVFRKLGNKPYDMNRSAMMLLESHDNNDGDAIFTMRFKYHSEGGQSELQDPEIDKMIAAAEMATGDDRRKLFEDVNRKIATEIVPDISLYYLVNYMRVGPRLDFKPGRFYSAATLELSKIKLAAAK